MKRISTKTTAESVLRELPSVLGAYVSEDMEGHPREIHLLVRDGPDPATLARDIRGLLEERLGIPIDQRVISIAQLAQEADSIGAPVDESDDVVGAPTPRGGPAAAPAAPANDGPAEDEPASRVQMESRPRFAGLESSTSAGHVTVAVTLEWKETESRGMAEAVDTQAGRARASAAATLRSAAEAPWNDALGLELDFASIVQALDGEYVLVSVLGMSPRLGRRPLPLVGVHPVESDVESAAALATLKAINRVLSLALKHD